ncbi:MAG: NAD(P)-binding domain-containing protein, partial [Chloroflexota bacterium]
MNHTFDVVIIGGGQAGLVTGYYLNNHTRNYVILDANEQIGGAWQHYYESLKLFSPVRWAELPGLPFEADPDHYPTRNEVIDYLRDYARVHDLPVRSGVRVTSVERDESGFTLHTDGGDTYRAGAVVSASGPHNTPHMPALTGAEQFTGPRVHSYDYKNPEPYRDQHVVVIGARDSAMQIAYELAQVARVSMAVRHDLKFMPKYILGLSVFWWLHETGYDELPLGLFSHVEGTDRIVGKEPYQTALAAGNPQPKPMF